MRRVVRFRVLLPCLASLALFALAGSRSMADEASSTVKPPTASPVATPAMPPSEAPGIREGEIVPPRPRVSPLRPMMVELRALLDAEREQVAALTARLKSATDEAGSLAIQREIEKLKIGTESAMLRVQAKHARRAGREALAAQLELAAEDLLAPPKRVEPSSVRPAPEGATSETSR